MRRQLQGACAEEDGMSHYENLVQEVPSIMYYLGKYDWVSSITFINQQWIPHFPWEFRALPQHS